MGALVKTKDRSLSMQALASPRSDRRRMLSILASITFACGDGGRPDDTRSDAFDGAHPDQGQAMKPVRRDAMATEVVADGAHDSPTDANATPDGGLDHPAPVLDGSPPQADARNPDAPADRRPNPPPTPEISDACARYAAAYCERSQTCAPFRFSWTSEDACRNYYQFACVSILTTPGIDEPPAQLRACASDLRSQSCDDFNGGRAVPTCFAMPGTVGIGGPCRISDQCGTGLFCGTRAGAAPGCGTCQPRVAPGASCTMSPICPRGHLCAGPPGATSGTCQRVAAAGDGCGPGVLCALNTVCIQGVCRRLPGGPGASCAQYIYCDLVQDLYCNRITLRCERNPQPAPAGAACGPRNDGSGAGQSCVPGARCIGSTSTRQGMCLADIAVGQPCTLLLGAFCEPPAQCVAGRCRSSSFANDPGARLNGSPHTGCHPPRARYTLLVPPLKDITCPHPRLLLVGINPSLRSWAVGHHFAGPGNPFWRLLHTAGLVPEPLTYEHDERLAAFGIALTNLCPRATRSAAELRPDEIEEGRVVLARKIARLKPRVVAFVGVSLYQTYFGLPRSGGPGPKPERIAGAAVFVVPNPSGLNASFPGFAHKLIWYERLRGFVDEQT